MWTAYYGPDESFKSGFVNEKAARAYVKSRQDLDDEAWFLLETKYFEKCVGFYDVMTGAGYYPVARLGQDPITFDSDRWLQFEEVRQKLGMELIEVTTIQAIYHIKEEQTALVGRLECGIKAKEIVKINDQKLILHKIAIYGKMVDRGCECEACGLVFNSNLKNIRVGDVIFKY